MSTHYKIIKLGKNGSNSEQCEQLYMGTNGKVSI